MQDTWPPLGVLLQVQQQLQDLQKKGMTGNPKINTENEELNYHTFLLKNKKQNYNELKNPNTMAILPNKEVAVGGFLCGVAPLAPAAFKLRWSKNNNVDVLDSQ